MRALLAAAVSVLTLAAAGAATAEMPSNVSVSIGPELQSKASRFGDRDVEELKEDLAKSVARGLERSGARRADLVLEAATPNRPTFEQMRRQPGLSFWSLGVGGASVTGTVTLADGSTQPVSYRWYQTDIRQTFGATTWLDANRAFDFLSYRIAKGNLPNQGPHKVGDRDSGMFGAFGTARF
jgi:hypothetical protein